MRFKLKPECAIALVFLLACSAMGLADDAFKKGQTYPVVQKERLDALVAAGVRLDDASQLAVILRINDRGLAVNAAYALGLIPRSDEAVRDLNETVKSGNETLMGYAAEALFKLGEKAWVPLAQERLPFFEWRAPQLSLAGLLAEAGVYDGWPLVIKTIMDPDADRTATLHALIQVPSFTGMKDSSGKPVNLAEELKALLPKAPPPHREWIMLFIKQLSPRRPVKRDVPGPPA